MGERIAILRISLAYATFGYIIDHSVAYSTDLEEIWTTEGQIQLYYTNAIALAVRMDGRLQTAAGGRSSFSYPVSAHLGVRASE
jgi:hypothetical protein